MTPNAAMSGAEPALSAERPSQAMGSAARRPTSADF